MREARAASQRSANYLRKSARVANPRALSERNVNGGALPFSCAKPQALRFVSEGARDFQRRAVRSGSCEEMLERIATPRRAPRLIVGDYRLHQAQENDLLLRKPLPNHRLRASIAHLIDAGTRQSPDGDSGAPAPCIFCRYCGTPRAA